MVNSYPITHNTAAKSITGAAGEGWEFHCNDCNFRMRYIIPECSQAAHLEVISLGDTDARHLSDFDGLEKGRPPIEGEWLTFGIRQTIEKILKKFDK